MGWIRRNLLVILFGTLIALQVGIWITLLDISHTIERWGCGSRTYPCKVIVVPDR